MKKLSYFALALISMTLFACGSKPAATDQSSAEVEYVEETHEEAMEILEVEMAAEAAKEASELAETPAEAPVETADTAKEAVEEPAPEIAEASAPEPAETPTPEPAEAPVVPSDKFEIRGSDGNYIAFVSEIVTTDANRCIPLNMVLDKKEESKVRVVIQVAKLDGTKIGLFPVGIEPGGTKANSQFCPPMGGVFDGIQPGEQYKLSFVRAQLQ